MAGWLNFIGTELHKNYSPLFDPEAGADTKAYARSALSRRYTYVNSKLGGQDYLCGNRFSVADVYLFVISNWAGLVQFELDGFPHLQAFQKRIGARPAVQQALRAEGLIA